MTGDRVGGTVGGTVLHNAKGKGRRSQNAASKRCWHYLGSLLPPIAAYTFAGLPNASNYRYSPRFSCGDVQVCRLPAQCLRATHRLTPGFLQAGFASCSARCTAMARSHRDDEPLKHPGKLALL